jgi:hypothetical protein
MPSIAAETAQALLTLGRPVPPEVPAACGFEAWGSLPAEAPDPSQRQLPARLGSLGELHESFNQIMDKGWVPFTPGHISTGRNTNPHAQAGPDTAYTPGGYVPGPHSRFERRSSQPLASFAGLPLRSPACEEPPPNGIMPPWDKPHSHRLNRGPEKQSSFKRRLAVASALGITILGAASMALGFYLQARGR